MSKAEEFNGPLIFHYGIIEGLSRDSAYIDTHQLLLLILDKIITLPICCFCVPTEFIRVAIL